MLLDLKLPPGVYRQGTFYQSKGRYADCNLVRWFEGTLRPVGGWVDYRTDAETTVTVSGAARGSHAWRSNDNDKFCVIGTHTGLYAFGSRIVGMGDITPAGLAAGYADNASNTGYGGRGYGTFSYGTPRAAKNIVNFATTWSFDNFGQELLAVNSADGRLLRWNLTDATAGTITPTAGTVPTGLKGVVVTDERFVFALQAGGNKRLIQWADQESLTNWSITATTQAGGFELATSGEIMSAKRVRGQTLIVTSTDAHVANYIGPPLVYGFELVATGCGAVSRNALVAGGNAGYWMTSNGFWVYDGQARPIPCEVSDYVFSRINSSQLHKVWGVLNHEFGEVTWYYPSTTSEVDSYVTYSFREGHWSTGSMQRTTGVDNSVFPKPLRVGADGKVYEHESGFSYGGDVPYATSGPLELGNGGVVMMCRQVIPDEKTQGDVVARFATRLYPQGAEFAFGPYSMAAPTSIRLSGRQVAVRFEGARNADWRVGVPRVDAVASGVR